MILMIFAIVLLLFGLFLFEQYEYSLSLYCLIISCAALCIDYVIKYPVVQSLMLGIVSFGLINTTLVYVGIGIVVATIKWIALNISFHNILKQAVDDFNNDNPTARIAMSENMLHHLFVRYWNEHHYANLNPLLPGWVNVSSPISLSHEDYMDEFALEIKCYASYIGNWIVLWPYAVVSLFAHDIVTNVAKIVKRRYCASTTLMSRGLVNHALKGLRNDD